MHSCRGLIVILGMLVASWAQAAPLADDQEALQGTWQGVQSGIVFRCTFGQLFAFVAEGPNVQLDSTGLGYELKVEGKERIVELDRRSADVAGIPNRLVYRLEKDTLRLTFPDGALRGTWVLKRKSK